MNPHTQTFFYLHQALLALHHLHILQIVVTNHRSHSLCTRLCLLCNKHKLLTQWHGAKVYLYQKIKIHTQQSSAYGKETAQHIYVPVAYQV
jgi:hypothetical protein